MDMDKVIEKHPDFRLTRYSEKLIKEKGESLTPEKVKQLEEQSTLPVKDFLWTTKHKKTRVSEMDKKFLLICAKHCVYKTDRYGEKIEFFLDVLEIIESHALSKFGIEIPDNVEGIQALIDTMDTQEVDSTEVVAEPTQDSAEIPGSGMMEISSDMAREMAASITIPEKTEQK